MAETLCPRCFYTPIPDGAEFCPRCNERFVPEMRETTYITRTRAGGLTGAVTANPVPSAIVLAAGALFWVVRASNLLTSKESLWGFALAALCAAAAALLMATVGPAKHAALLVGVVELVAGVALWATGSPLRLLVVTSLHGAVLIAMTAEEPGRARLTLGAVLGCLAAAAGVGALAWDRLPLGPSAVVLGGRGAGFELRLPKGWSALDGPALAPLLELAADGGVAPKGRLVGFGSTSDGVRVGALVVAPWEGKELLPAESQLAVRCEAALQRLGATGSTVLPGPPPPALGQPARFGELTTQSGASGRYGCGVAQDRFLALVVVGQPPATDESSSAEASAVAVAFEELAAELVVAPPGR